MKLLEVTEVADILGVHKLTVQKLLRDGKLKGFKLGSWKIREQDVDEYINSNFRDNESSSK